MKDWYATIEDLLFSKKNSVAVEEKIGQFHDLFKMLLSAHEEYNTLFEDEARVKVGECLMRLTTKYFPLEYMLVEERWKTEQKVHPKAKDA